MATVFTRTQLGRLVAYGSTPISGVSEAFDVSDWELESGLTTSIVSGRLRITSVGNTNPRQVINLEIADRSDIYLQVRHQLLLNASVGGLVARSDSVESPITGVQFRAPFSFSGTEGLYEYSAGTVLQSATTAAVNRALPERFALMTVGTVGKAYNFDANVERTLSNALTLGAGKAGIYYASGVNNYQEISDFYACTSNILTVQDFTGMGEFYAVLKNSSGTILATSPNSTGGLLQWDLFAARIIFPQASEIEIYLAADNSLVVEDSPFEYVWGGDVYNITDDSLTGGPFVSYTFVMPSGSMNTDWLNARGAEGYQLQKVVPISPIAADGTGLLMCYFLSGSKF